MSIQYNVLGDPGRDNALLVVIDSGQAVTRLLFDLGSDCLKSLESSTIHSIDAVFLSHCHVDHISGFDTFLRFNWYRHPKPVQIIGPQGVTEIIHHRLQGITWNLVDDEPGEWYVHEVTGETIRSTRFLACEGFATAHPVEERPFDPRLCETDEYCVDVCIMDHGIPCLAYVVREQPKQNVDMQALSSMGLKPGAWLKQVKDESFAGTEQIDIDGKSYALSDLRLNLLVSSTGDSVAYLTDFLLDPESEDRLVALLEGCEILICENNYRTTDADLATKNYHMTSADVARLAGRVAPREVVLFHLSDRYTPEEWQEQLGEVRQQFPAARFPVGWEM